MANLDDCFPSKFLKVRDLAGQRRRATIKAATLTTVGSGTRAEQKIVVEFAEAFKPLVLNKTNATKIASIAKSRETDAWPKTAIVLVPTTVEFQGEIVDTIRIDRAAPTKVARPVAADPDDPMPVAATTTVTDDVIDDTDGGDDPF